MRDIMIDIETLGTRPGSIIISIGAVSFDAETGEVGDTFYNRIDATEAEAYGLTFDMSTIVWWMQQDEEARNAAFTGQANGLGAVLYSLSEFIVRNSDGGRIWGNGPSFDLVLLETAYREAGILVPWSFRAHRDLRTLRDITGVDIPQVGTTHNALDDAMAQAMAVIKAYEVLGLSRQPISVAA
ncbi:3'-5' exonuclease [Brucella intermedia]|uniref:3'-5' exonuclease n=1 Tax=Brucella intermedia TaxID=94625 RepID=UPI00158EBEA5|nr:3'-5' exonuclease [Brucella intermedia]NYD84384.1 hypothetical protein [Brucella intermedia]